MKSKLHVSDWPICIVERLDPLKMLGLDVSCTLVLQSQTGVTTFVGFSRVIPGDFCDSPPYVTCRTDRGPTARHTPILGRAY